MASDPKPKRIKLNQKEYHELRRQKWLQARLHCEICHAWTSLETGHFHHIVSRGAGGDDTIENGLWLCAKCHDKKHRGLI